MKPRARREFGDVVGQANKRLDLRGKEEVTVSPAEVEGLDADRVPRNKEIVAIGEGEGEHPVEIAGTGRATFRVEGESGLTVALRPEPITILQAGSQRPEVVDLAVGDDGAAAFFGPDRLIAFGRIHNGQPAVPQHRRPRRIPEDSLRVGAAVNESVYHRADGLLIARAPDSSDATHGSYFSFPSNPWCSRNSRATSPRRRFFSSTSKLSRCMVASSRRPPSSSSTWRSSGWASRTSVRTTGAA